MGMFDYKNYSSNEAAKLVEDISLLSAYTNSFKIGGFIPGVDVLNTVGSLTGDLLASEVNLRIPDGWIELTATDLGLSPDSIDNSGFFTIPSFFLGTVFEGPQAKIFGQYNEAGDLVRINFDAAGTNGLADLIDYTNLNSREGVELFDPILKVVQQFAESNGLQGSDVVISGYSLGAAVANVLAAERENLADGFFKDSDYLAFAVPTIYDNSDVVLNFGYENDVVHRITGDETSFVGALQATDFGLINPDKEFSSSVDNFVLFNDVYASPLIWNLSPFSLLNVATGWFAHNQGVATDAISRVIDSSFYEDTKMDSTVVVAELSAVARGTTWVEDYATTTSSHYGSSAFLVGSKFDDLIAGGSNYDYIDAGLGDDTIKAGIGIDHIDGNFGIDEVRVAGRGDDWDVYKMTDDTLFFVDKDGVNLVEADNVESVSFQKEINSHTNNYEITDAGLIDHRFLIKHTNNGDKNFLDHVEGTEGDDTLDGEIVFGREGNDTINGTDAADILHGGRGDDVIYGLEGNDRIYGAEGDDVLNGGLGDDILIGGVGNDTFVIDSLSGNDVIADFNNDAGYQDVLQFSSELFADMNSLISQTSQNGSNVSVALTNQSYLMVENCSVEDVLNCSIIA